VLFESRGVLGLGRATQIQREKYTSGMMKTVFEKIAEKSKMKSLSPDVHTLIVSMVEPEFSKFLGTPIDHLISHNAGERSEVFAARIESLRAALDLYLADASLVTTLLKTHRLCSLWPLALVLENVLTCLGLQAFEGSSPCGVRGEETSTYFAGLRSNEPLMYTQGFCLVDRLMTEHSDELPEQVFDEQYRVVNYPRGGVSRAGPAGPRSVSLLRG
jgi:hypothetical protein